MLIEITMLIIAVTRHCYFVTELHHSSIIYDQHGEHELLAGEILLAASCLRVLLLLVTRVVMDCLTAGSLQKPPD